MDASGYGSIYGSLSDYFNAANGNRSQGRSGGPGGSAQQFSGGSGTGDTTSIAPTAGNAGWVSASVGLSSSDKSSFSTPFSQQFGGITNNQVIDSPGATGATTVSPIAPITSPQATGSFSQSQAGLAGSPILLIVVIFAGVALILKAR